MAPKVGIGVLVHMLRTNKILMGKRKGSIGAGTFALPGGHLELGESFSDCAIRETEEETGLKLSSVSFYHVVNTVFSKEAHYVTIFMCGTVPEGTEAKLREPRKCEGWHWVDQRTLPHLPLFRPLELLLQEKGPELQLSRRAD